MTFLDSSTIIHYLDGTEAIAEYLDEETSPPYLTSSLCVYEVLMGAVHTDGSTDFGAERSRFGWVASVDLTEEIGIEAARLQEELKQTGDLLTPRDALIAATARTAGDELVVVDSDFETAGLQDMMAVTVLPE
ncbi:PIN domain-containing protein [Halobellus ordinarius]|uniref:PIN domain-containing protein n=1 Tax=Halobellus ordinarius TaxID=3075120 RepID=UPI00288040CD|nr:PIN domain-containing protein [Halobellus sp. ZY16]